MPTYEYSCKSCGQHLEVVQSFKDSALSECPACGGPLRKVFGNIGIAFKGNGFYRTDSRSSGVKTAASTSDTKSGDSPATAPSSEKNARSEKNAKSEKPATPTTSAGTPSSASSGSGGGGAAKAAS